MLNAKGKKILKSSYSVLQDDFFHFMRAAGYDDVERGERGSTEEHLTVTQFKVAQEQQRLEAVTAQITQSEQALDTAQAAVEKKRKELHSLQKQAKETYHRPDCAGNPLHGEKDDHRQHHSDPIRVQHAQGLCGQWNSCQGGKQPLGRKAAQQAQKSVAVWKQRYELLKEQARPYLEAVKLAPEKVRAFLDAILTRTRQTKQHDQSSRRKSQDMEL